MTNWLKQLFTRKVWTEVERFDLYRRVGNDRHPIGYLILLKDQFGNLKKVKVP